jgi:hypothetical protein
MDYLVPIIVALISSGIAFLIGHRQLKQSIEESERRMRLEYGLQHSIERSIQRLLSRGWEARSFAVIKHHIRGFSDDELRQALVRSGAIAFESDGREFWGLLETIGPRLPTKESYEREGWVFRKLPMDPPRLD